MCGALKLLKYNANKQMFFLITENMQRIESKKFCECHSSERTVLFWFLFFQFLFCNKPLPFPFYIYLTCFNILP